VIEFKVDDLIFVGWTDVQITRNMNQATSTFSVKTTEHPENTANLVSGSKCEISYEGQTILTGIVDSINLAYDDKSHTLSVSGRSLTKDLVDCSVLPPFQFSNMSVGRLVTALATYYNVAVIDQSGDLSRIANFQTAASGESCFVAIERAAELKALRITDDPQGNLVLTQTGTIKSKNTIDPNVRILSADMSLDESRRYSKITIKGQSKPTDDWHGTRASTISASAYDENVIRHRELIIKASNDVSQEDAQKLAEWEIASRASNAMQLTYTLQGWTGSAGELWYENQLVSVDDPVLGIQTEYLITQVDYAFSKSGSKVKLELADPDTYIPRPVFKKITKTKLGHWYS